MLDNPATDYSMTASDVFAMSSSMLAKQAKPLSRRQIALTTALLQQTRYPSRNHAIFLLSIKAGLRAKEIASLTWDMVTMRRATSDQPCICATKPARACPAGDPLEQGPQSSSSEAP